MAGNQSFFSRFETYRASKATVFWFGAGCAVATMVVGFTWGGWVSGGTAESMAKEAASGARAELAAAACTDRFAKSTDAAANLATLKSSDSWDQDKFIEKGGWATLPGSADPVPGAATLCARQLIEAVPAEKAASKSG